MKEIPAGTGHKGKVLQVMDAGSYTYLEVEEKGQKLWIAALKTKLNKGDIVEFPDSKPMEKFESKTLKRTFDKIIFAESIQGREVTNTRPICPGRDRGLSLLSLLTHTGY